MGCCAWLELFRRVKRGHGSESKSVTLSFVKRLSHEHLLGYNKRDESKSVSLRHTNHGKSFVPISCYEPSHVVENESNSHISTRGSFLIATDNEPLTCKIPVKMTNRALRSQILHEPLYVPDKSNPHLVSLFEGLLCKVFRAWHADIVRGGDETSMAHRNIRTRSFSPQPWLTAYLFACLLLVAGVVDSTTGGCHLHVMTEC
ncbi:hypothetical protein L7F22_056206 [Adiantum nelumboides]|nr:hypothetical protein [Adiantum nelumboides]